MSSRVRAPRGAPGRIHPVVAPGCSSDWTEHPVRDRGVGGWSPFNQTSGGHTAAFGSGPVAWTLGSGPRDGGSNPSSRAPERPGQCLIVPQKLNRESAVLSRRRQRDRNRLWRPSPGGETDDHRRLRISSSGFESWPGCHLVVAQTDKSAALRRQRPLVRVQSTRPRRHSSVGRAQPRYG